MKMTYAVVAPVFLWGFFVTVLADDKPRIVHPGKIKDKVSVALGEAFTVEFNRDGDQLVQPSKSKGTGAKKVSVKVTLDATSASPFPPPRDGATRPFLSVENNFESTLRFRALVRLKDNQEFFEISEGMEPVPAGESFNKCWDFDSLVEEVVLYEFKLSDKSAE